LKNPWSHLRWRGNFSELDTVHWTESLKKALNFDPKTASVVDNGNAQTLFVVAIAVDQIYQRNVPKVTEADQLYG